MVCPYQTLDFVTYPIINSSDIILYPEMAITQPGVIQYTVYVRKGFYYASDIMIIDNDRGVDMKTVLFSKWPLVDVVCCVVFNLLILWPQVHNVQDCPLTTPPY